MLYLTLPFAGTRLPRIHSGDILLFRTKEEKDGNEIGT
jgi:hypothetical protein